MADNRRESLRRAQARYNARRALELWLSRYQGQLDSAVLGSVANAIALLSPLASNSASKQRIRKADSDK